MSGQTFGDKRAAWKYPVRVVATSNLDLSGVETIDGVSVVAEDHVLCVGQSTASENGIYVCKAGVWVRRDDWAKAAQKVIGARIPVTEGSTGAGKVYRYSAANTFAVADLTVGQTAAALLDEGVAQVKRFDIGHADLTAPATSETLDLFVPHATRSAIIKSVFAVLTTEFSGGSVSALTAEIGQDQGPDTDGYVAAFDVFTGAGAGPKGNTAAGKGTEFAAGTAENQVLLQATQAVTITFAATDDNVDALTAGALQVFVEYTLEPAQAS